MKKIVFTLTLLCITIVSILAQAPQVFKYQAIARDNLGNILENRDISFRISLLIGRVDGDMVYGETHSIVTNKFGLANLEIGRGDNTFSRFSDIDWSTDKFFIKIEMDENGGSDFKLMGTSQLFSVPFALYAQSSGNGKGPGGGGMWKKNGSDLYYNTGNVGVGTDTPSTNFEVIGIITSAGGNSDNWNSAYGWGDHAQEGYLTSESDPKIGSNSTDYISKWDGTAMVSGSIYDNGNVAIGTSAPDPSAAFEVNSNTKGFLPPRMTTAERDVIPSPTKGLIIYNTVDDIHQGFNGTIWQSFAMVSCVPIQPLFINGQVSVGCMASEVNYSIDPIENALNYTWFVPPDATISSGQGSTNIVVNFGVLSGNVSVFATNGCGNGESKEKTIALEVPLQPGPITGPVDPESGATGIIYSINPISGVSSYFWTVPEGASITDGQGTTAITVNFGTTAGLIQVCSSNDCGNSPFQDLQVWFSGTILIDSRDGQMYNIVTMGSQIWMAENLNIGTMINSTQDQSNNGIVEKYCYDDNEANCDVYGGLYFWEEMLNYNFNGDFQGICPEGWHIPSNDEWSALINHLGVYGPHGGMMKEAGFEHWSYPNIEATNISGFTGLPAGMRLSGGVGFGYFLHEAFFRSTTDYSPTGVWTWKLSFNSSVLGTSPEHHKDDGLSVRCIKN